MLLNVVFSCAVALRFTKSEYLDVFSGKYLSAANQPAIILILKILVYGVMGCCVCNNGLF